LVLTELQAERRADGLERIQILEFNGDDGDV
jgi:hypothetical protein